MSISKINSGFLFLLIIILLNFSARTATAQTTAFTYQAKLADNGNLANGNYDLQFKLFDTVTVGTGTQQGSTVTASNVIVTNGIFTVQLDFGVCTNCFNGANRFLEISVKPTSGGSFTTLGPRQPVTSNPYAIKSLNAATADGLSVACISCVTSSQIQSVNGSAVTGQIPVASVPAGSTNYIQNVTSQQTAANFNISGNGTVGGTLSANAITSTTQFNIGSFRVLSRQGNENIFVGAGTGQSNTTGGGNSFVGANAGLSNTTGQQNSFFGNAAGFSNLTGANNSFFGFGAGNQNTAGTDNAFFGANAGINNTASFNAFFGSNAGYSTTSGTNNAFFGAFAGIANLIGTDNAFFGTSAGGNNTASDNSFFGAFAGDSNTTGTRNSFFGSTAGDANQIGSDNAFFGYNAGKLNTGSFNSFFGSGAGDSTTSGTNNAFFGYNAGQANQTGNNNSFFGYNAGSLTTASANSFFGNSAGAANTTGTANAFIGYNAGLENITGADNSFFGANAGQNNTASFNSFFGRNAGHSNSTGSNNTFIGQSAGQSNTTGSSNTLVGWDADVGAGNLSFATAIGSGAVANLSNSIYLGRADGSDAVRIPGPVVINGSLVVGTLGSAGSTSICLNVANRIAPCSSSLRYKTNIQTFTGGLDIIRRLRPITFTWKDGGRPDVGFAAEEVKEIAPLLATYNKDGQIEGVKYGQITTVLVNAVKQQQTQIEAQQNQIRDRKRQAAIQQTQIERYQKQLTRQQNEIDALKQLVCHSHPKAEICTATRRKR